MANRMEWVERALDELHSVGEMAESIERDLYISQADHAVHGAHYVASVIEEHGRAAKRYLSYAARCRQEVVGGKDEGDTRED